MSKTKTILSTIIILFFFLVFALPIIVNGINVMQKVVPPSHDIVKLVSETLWIYRLPEIYFHAFFLAATIIASLVALRKPPKFIPEATPEEIGIAYVGFETVTKEEGEEENA